jgi:hypothetical protein
MCTVIGWLGMPDANREGTALLLAAAALPVPLLLPRSGLWWSVPAVAPLLGAAGLAPLFLVVAGFAPTPWRRAGVGAAGLLWIVVAEALSGDTLLFGPPDGTRAHHLWEGSLSSAASHALWPALTSPALLTIVVWGAFAALLPFFVRGHSFALDVVGAAVWAAGLVAAHRGLTEVIGTSSQRADARGVAVTAAGAGLVSREPPEEGLPPRMATQ